MALTVRGSLFVLLLPLLAAGTGLAPAWSAPQPSAPAPSSGAAAPATDPPVVFWEPVDPKAPPPPKMPPAEEDGAAVGLPRSGPVPGGRGQRIPVLTPPPPGVVEGLGATGPAGRGARPPMPLPPGVMPPGEMPTAAGSSGPRAPGMMPPPPGAMPPGAMPPGAVPPGMMPPPPGMRQPGPPPAPQQAPKPSATSSLGPAAWLLPLLLLAGGAGTFVALRVRQRRRDPG